MQKLTWFKATIFSGRIDCVYVSIISFKEFIRLLIILRKAWRKGQNPRKKWKCIGWLIKVAAFNNIQSTQIGEATYLVLRHFVVVSQIFKSNLERDFSSHYEYLYRFKGTVLHSCYISIQVDRVTCYTENYYYKLKAIKSLFLYHLKSYTVHDCRPICVICKYIV